MIGTLEMRFRKLFIRPGKNRGILVSALVLLAFIAAPKLALRAQSQTQQQQSPQPQSTQPASQQAQKSQPQPQASSQQPQSQSAAPPKITVESKIVTVYASVRDKKGQIVSNLTKSDFAVDEDGHPETISYFARENDLPLNVGLLVDTSLSQRTVLVDERNASSTFIDHVMRQEKKDQAFLLHFDREVELLQDFTTSQKKLESALNLLQMPREEDSSDSSSSGTGRRRMGGTLLYDSIFLASDELMKKQQGRKAVIVLSDGVDRGSKESLQTSIEAAQRANTIVYSVLFKGEEPNNNNFGHHRGGWGMGGPMGGPGGGGGQRRHPQQREERPDGKKVLDRISKETGGRLFEVSKKQPLDQIYAQIEQELRDQYILGYVPDKADATGGGYHRIHLTTKQKDLAVQARDGYYSPSAPSAGQ